MSNKELCPNGFLIKERDCERIKYHGVNGYWPIDTYTEGLNMEEKIYLENYCEDNIYEPSNEINTVGVCNDIVYLNRYLDACERAKIKVDILYCCTDRLYPKSNIKSDYYKEKFDFLGYDYAYPGALYYSSIYHELKKINDLCMENKFNQFKVNKYGLLNSYREILEFIKSRDRLEKMYDYTFELGDFVVYKVWRCNKADLKVL